MHPIARPKSALRRRIRRLIAAAGLIALVFAIGNYLLVSAQTAAMLTRPYHGFDPQETPGTYHLAYQDVRFPARGGDVRIAGWYLPRADGHRATVLAHG